MPLFRRHFGVHLAAPIFTQHLGHPLPRLARKKGPFWRHGLPMISLKFGGNPGQSIAVWGDPISKSNRGKGCPISGIIPAPIQRPLFLPIILAILNRDYLTKRGNFGEPWIAQDFPGQSIKDGGSLFEL